MRYQYQTNRTPLQVITTPTSSEEDFFEETYRDILAGLEDSSISSIESEIAPINNIPPEDQQNIDNTTFDIAEVKQQTPNITFELFTLWDYTTMNIDFKLIFGDIKMH